MKTIINDTCDVVFKRLKDNKIVFTAEAQLASVSQKIKEDKVKGGIGNRTIAVLRSDKEVELKVRNAVFDSDWFEMAFGVSYEEATNTVFSKEEGLIAKDNAGTLELTITGTPKTGGIVKIIAIDGTQFDGTVSGKKVSFPATKGTEGKLYTVLYQIDVTGKTLKLLADKFSDKYYVEYRTIEYDIETNEIVNDLYWIFNSVMPNSSIDMSFENGKPQTPEFSFTALVPLGSNEIGKVIEVKRA